MIEIEKEILSLHFSPMYVPHLMTQLQHEDTAKGQRVMESLGMGTFWVGKTNSKRQSSQER